MNGLCKQSRCVNKFINPFSTNTEPFPREIVRYCPQFQCNERWTLQTMLTVNPSIPLLAHPHTRTQTHPYDRLE